MKKKIVSVLLCATMVTGLAMGCGKSSDSSSEKTSDGKTKIRMTYWNNEDTVKTLLDYLEKEVPDVMIRLLIHNFQRKKDRTLFVNHLQLH